jgi:hypothetical protein
MVMCPESKNDCTGEGQHKFTGLDWTGLSAYSDAACLHGLLFDTEDGGNTFFRNERRISPILFCAQNLLRNNIHYLKSLILEPPSVQYGC